MKLFVITDLQWDNYNIINKKFKKLNDMHTLNVLYNKNLSMLNNCAYKNNLTLIRNTGNNINETLTRLLSFTDICLIFTNNIEYNTPSYVVLNKCIEYNIPYITISEYQKNNDIDFYYSYNKDNNLSFRKLLKRLLSNNEKIERKICIDCEIIQESNTGIDKKPSISYDEAIELLNKCNIKCNENKQKHAIKLLYNKEEHKNEKGLKRCTKEMKHLNFNNNRINYYKNKTISES